MPEIVDSDAPARSTRFGLAARLRLRRGGRGRPVRGPGRRRDPWRLAFAALLVLALVGISGWVVLGSRLLVVRHVQVTGVHRLTAGQVRAAAHVPIGTPLARLDTGAVRASVATIPQVRAVAVQRHWPATVRIVVTERRPGAAVRTPAGYALVDPAGVTVATARHRPQDLPLLRVSGGLRGNPAVRAGIDVVAGLPRSLSTRVLRVEASNPQQVTLVLRAPHGRHTRTVRVRWGDPGQEAEKARALIALLRHHPAGRYDVSSPTVVTAH